MSLQYQNLDAQTRTHMIAELNADQAASRLYISLRFNENGVRGWATLLGEAISAHDDAWLATEIRSRNFLKSREERRNKTGETQLVQVPANAHETLAEGEFNRFYVRGLCLRAIEENVPQVMVYRARHSNNPRPESEAIMGKAFAPAALLNDLRSSPGVETALGVPRGPNSGLSVRLP